jgi:hypothetical protein
MLVDAVGDIKAQTGGDIEFYIDLVGIGASGLVQNLCYNCYLRAVKTSYLFLFFQVTTPSTGPWPAEVATPEGESYPGLQDEAQLRAAIEKVLQRPRTVEIVYYLRSMVR